MKRAWGWAAVLGLAAASVVLGWVAAEKEELVLYLFLVFPVFQAKGAWGMASVLLALAAFVSLLINLRFEIDQDGGEKGVSTGGVLLIGPVPIVFGTDRRITILTLMVAVAVLAALLLLLFL
ncbi:MAG: DUF131 domain-containing protein [Methanomassiliicoccales archaeon]|nr:DUF131 domain-containing protein [Methanomassiliicoccales archaeon]